MQASPAKNETRLPRAVLRVSEAVKAGIEARAALKTQDPAAGAQPPAADTVDPNTPASPAQPPADPRENDIDYWRHLAKSTAGRLKVAGEERRAEADEFRRQITELQGQVRSLQANQTAPSVEVDLSQFFTADQIEVLGQDAAEAIAKSNVATVRKMVQDALEAELKPLKDADKANREHAAKETMEAFFDQITALVPTWREVNVDEGFLAWLAEDDFEQQDNLDKGIARRSATKVANVFKTYLKTKERPAPPVAPNGTGASGGGDMPQPAAGGKTGYPSKDEIQAFYKRASTVRKGQTGYVTDQERTEFEARLRLRAPR